MNSKYENIIVIIKKKLMFNSWLNAHLFIQSMTKKIHILYCVLLTLYPPLTTTVLLISSE